MENLVDNPETDEVVDNPETPEAAPVAVDPAPVASWKNVLRTDLKDSSLVKKFDDNPDGLNKALESYGNLEKLLGHDKVPVPKGENDVEGWARWSKALGIPDKPDGYKLGDVQLPDSLKSVSFDKAKFAEIVHKHRLTPAQAQGLWKEYTQNSLEGYNNYLGGVQSKLEANIGKLKQEWGDAYNTNIELGQMVINQFSEGNQEMSDFLTAALSSDPNGIKFLAQIGKEFAENKIGQFNIKRFAMTPEDAKDEIQKIIRDENHPYRNPKATDKEHDEAVKYVNRLYGIINSAKGQA